MVTQISEPDWKLFRRLHSIVLDRFCQIVLSEVVQLASDSDKDSHTRYLDVYELIQKRDEEIGLTFNELKRSTAFMKLARMRSLGFVSDDEFAGFSSATQAVIAVYLDL